MSLFKEEVQQVGFLTGWRLMPRLWARNCASPAVVGWIKGRMTDTSLGTFSQILFRQSFTHHVNHNEFYSHIYKYFLLIHITVNDKSILFCSCSLWDKNLHKWRVWGRHRCWCCHCPVWTKRCVHTAEVALCQQEREENVLWEGSWRHVYCWGTMTAYCYK